MIPACIWLITMVLLEWGQCHASPRIRSPQNVHPFQKFIPVHRKVPPVFCVWDTATRKSFSCVRNLNILIIRLG